MIDYGLKMIIRFLITAIFMLPNISLAKTKIFSSNPNYIAALTQSSNFANSLYNLTIYSSGIQISTSASFNNFGIIGPIGVGFSKSASYGNFSGYSDFNSGSNSDCCEIRGDSNHSGFVDISDLIFIVDFIFDNGDQLYCWKEFDNNIDGNIDIVDLTIFVDFMFRNSAPLPPCG